jgi:hypothetical protein
MRHCILFMINTRNIHIDNRDSQKKEFKHNLYRSSHNNLELTNIKF